MLYNNLLIDDMDKFTNTFTYKLLEMLLPAGWCILRASFVCMILKKIGI